MERIHGARSQGRAIDQSNATGLRHGSGKYLWGLASQGGEWGLALLGGVGNISGHTPLNVDQSGKWTCTPCQPRPCACSAWRHIPVIGFCAPVIEEMNARRCVSGIRWLAHPQTTWAAHGFRGRHRRRSGRGLLVMEKGGRGAKVHRPSGRRRGVPRKRPRRGCSLTARRGSLSTP